MAGERHGRGTAWARHGHGVLCVNRPLFYHIYRRMPTETTPHEIFCRNEKNRRHLSEQDVRTSKTLLPLFRHVCVVRRLGTKAFNLWRKTILNVLLPFSFLGALEKLWKATTSIVMSIRPSLYPLGTTRLPLDKCSWCLLLGIFLILSGILEFL